MTVWVLRDGLLVEKGLVDPLQFAKTANFGAPAISRFEAMESPVTGQVISSERQRQRDMAAVNCVDPRDFPRDFVFKKGRNNGRT
jgi:hypothetical protein